MVWFRDDDGLHSDPRYLRLPRAVRLQCMGLRSVIGTWCARNGTDGHVPDYIPAEFGGTPAICAHLVRVGFWEVVPDGWQWVRWAPANELRQHTEKRLADTAARVAAHRAKDKPEGIPTPSAPRPHAVRTPSAPPADLDAQQDLFAPAEPVTCDDELVYAVTNGGVTGLVTPPNPSLPNPSQREGQTLDAPPPDPFDEFWSVYPRRDDKVKARAKYAQALKRAHPEVILAGAQRYRDDPNREAAFTKQPATWLGNDCWDNPPLPPRGTRGPRHAPAMERMRETINLGVQMDAMVAAAAAANDRMELTQ